MPKYACRMCGAMSSSRLCPEHAAARASNNRQKERRRGSAWERGYDTAWRRTRAQFLYEHPNCEVCGELATDVHHIDGKGPKGERGHDHSNLQALCHSHHSQVTASDLALRQASQREERAASTPS